MEELKDYRTIFNSEIKGYLVHIYEWDSPASAILPKYAVSVKLRSTHGINVAIKTYTPDLKTSSSLMSDRILTGNTRFDEKILIYGIGEADELLQILDKATMSAILSDDHLRMEINPEVVVIRRIGEAQLSTTLESDVNLAIAIAGNIDRVNASTDDLIDLNKPIES
jgi:hypothetical protein